MKEIKVNPLWKSDMCDPNHNQFIIAWSLNLTDLGHFGTVRAAYLTTFNGSRQKDLIEMACENYIPGIITQFKAIIHG